MGLTQQKQAVATIKEIVNLLLLRGNIGKPGRGRVADPRATATCRAIAPWASGSGCRAAFLDALGREFGFEPPRERLDAVDAMRDASDGTVKVFFALGGNFVGAISDTERRARHARCPS